MLLASSFGPPFGSPSAARIAVNSDLTDHHSPACATRRESQPPGEHRGLWLIRLKFEGFINWHLHRTLWETKRLDCSALQTNPCLARDNNTERSVMPDNTVSVMPVISKN